jgi:colanic acid/amylovoran biosynthesis glycosyltransferase
VTRQMRLVYVTARLPFGVGEPFIVPEIEELERQGCAIEVVPVRPGGEIPHRTGERLVSRAACVPLLSVAVARAALAETFRRPATVLKSLAALRESGSAAILLKNLAVFPKALWLARRARLEKADHLHAHWASTSATLAMVAAQVSGISWSFTAHRWDIRENNLLGLKARGACFVRAISVHGAEELAAAAGAPGWSPWVLHMGVRLPRPQARPRPEGPLRVLTAARLVEKKGHVYLLEAARLLRERGVSVRIELAGDGPLDALLRGRAAELGLDEVIFLGNVSHDELLKAMSDGRWDAVVLPSVVTQSGDLEGIPVSLIEAMGLGLPVVSTNTGGIPELLEGGVGILVPPNDAQAIADAVERLTREPALRAELAARGRARVEEAFSLERTAAALLARFRACASAGA